MLHLAAGSQARDRDGLDLSLRERFAEATQIGFQLPDHHRLEVPRADFHAAGKALRVEHFEQRREAIGVAVVFSGGEEQAVLEAMSHRARALTPNRKPATGQRHLPSRESR